MAAVPNFFEMRRYTAPLLRVTVKSGVANLPNCKTFGTRVTGPGGGVGRTNGMPWDGTSPITVGTVIYPTRPAPIPRSDPNTPIWAWDLEKSWAMAQNPFFRLDWLGLSTKLEDAAAQIIDPEFSGELSLLAGVAYQRYLDA